MTTADGSVLGVTKLIDHGPDTQRWNLVVLGDGYQASEMATYHSDVDRFIQIFEATEPFHQLWGKINIHRVDVTSTDSGATDPVSCPLGGPAVPATGKTSRTYFDASFCAMGVTRRLLEGNTITALNVATMQVPQVHVTMVIVNSPQQYGGSGGPVAWCSSESTSAEIAVHEIAHTYFLLEDEYGDGVPAHLGVGQAPNLSTDTNRATTDWHTLISPTTPLPTMPNPYPGQDNHDPSPVPAGTVGLFEGAGRQYQGVYRAEYDCAMRSFGEPFCQVCQRQIRLMLSPFSGVPMSWDINGNSGTNPATDFLGTTDNQPLVIKTNGTERANISSNEVRFKVAINSENAFNFVLSSGASIGKLWSTRSGYNALNLNAGGRDPAVTITDKGNVGIGTNKPDTRLVVYDGSLLMQAGKGSPGEIAFRGSTGVLKARVWSEAQAGTGLYLSSGGSTPNVTVHSSGSVGIGTLTPGAKLEINNGDLLMKAAGTDPGDIVFQDSAGTQKARIWSVPAAGAGLYLSSGDLTPDIAIDATGNVGVGVVQPNTKLDVRSSSPGNATVITSNIADGAALWAVANTTRLAASIASNGGTGAGVQGIANQTTATSFGVLGMTGPSAISPTAAFSGGIGVVGYCPTGTGVGGMTDGQGVAVNGVEGLATAGIGAGVHGRSNSISGVGLFADNPGGGLAGRFMGNVSIQGGISASTKAFRIDHPLDPANKYLNHSSIESPDMMNVYNGNITTDAACQAVVELPAYFQALNSDFRYQLTVIGKLALVAVASEIKDNRFVIRSDRPKVKVSWQVTGIRKDPYAKANRIKVELDKKGDERGRYLHPELYTSKSAKPEARVPIGALGGMLAPQGKGKKKGTDPFREMAAAQSTRSKKTAKTVARRKPKARS